MKQQKHTNYDNFINFLSNGLKNDLKKLRSFKRRNFLKHLNSWDSKVEYFRGEILDGELIEILLRNFYKQEFFKAAKKNHSIKIVPTETYASILQSWLLKKENEFMEEF